jgi:diphthamide biosynthesis enzyme Dph1/Dph2-like protein
MKRYAVVQKARDADVFGILVGTLGVGDCPNFFRETLLLIAHQLPICL